MNKEKNDQSSQGKSEAAARPPGFGYKVKTNEELRRATAEDLVQNGKYDTVEEAMKALLDAGF